MNTIDTLGLPSAESTGRFNIYKLIHKALRARMAHVLVRLGNLDVNDRQDLHAGLDELDALLVQCIRHVQHENDFLHPVLQTLLAGSADEAADAHEEHHRAVASLEAASAALRERPDALAALGLYRQFAVFVGDNLLHMQHEETRHNAVLWQHCTDGDIEGIERRLHASVPPTEMNDILLWMGPAMNPAERSALFTALQALLPPEAFQHHLDQMRSRLNERSWAKLARALGRAPVPGLVTV